MTLQSLSNFHPATILSTWFWTGLSPRAPGTIGSLASLPFGYLVFYLFGQSGLISAIFLIFITGCWSTHIYITRNGKADPGEVVIDEVVGQWIPLLIAGVNLWLYVPAFLLFRLFDIWKPWPISWLDKNVKGAFGVMIDDILAGIFAAICMSLILWGYHAYF